MAELRGSSRHDLLLVHHSMGHDRLDEILHLASRKALLYHNITPSVFFPLDSPYHRYAAVGRQQLHVLRTQSRPRRLTRSSARVSSEAGLRSVRVLPVLVDVDRLRAMAPRLEPQPPVGRPFTILFVGRICESKGHMLLVETVRALATLWDSPSAGVRRPFLRDGSLLSDRQDHSSRKPVSRLAFCLPARCRTTRSVDGIARQTCTSLSANTRVRRASYRGDALRCPRSRAGNDGSTLHAWPGPASFSSQLIPPTSRRP